MREKFDTNNKVFGEKLYNLRKDKNMTQESLADLLQVTRQSVSKWESGVAFPETEKIIELTKIFEVSLDFLLADKVSPPPVSEKRNKLELAIMINTILLFVLGLAPLLITVMFLAFFPSQIPAHYNSAGEITRWGSKYENLIFPSINIVFAGLLYILERLIKKHINAKEMLAVKITLNIAILTMFILIIYFLVKSYLIAVDTDQVVTINNFQIAFLAFGLFLFTVGIIMPLAPKNALFGLRINLSMQSDELWKLSQIAAGTSIAILGFLLIAINTFYSNGVYNAIISLPITLVFMVIALVSPYIIAKNRRTSDK